MFSKATLSLFVTSGLALTFVGPSLARVWVVDQAKPGAADTNGGTDDQPLLTINAAAQKAEPGDTVLVRPGLYRERVTPARGGTPEQPIIYQAQPNPTLGQAVVVRGSDAWPASYWQPVPNQPGVYAAEIDGHLAPGFPNPFLLRISISDHDEGLAARPVTEAKEKEAMPKTLGQLFFDGHPMAEVSSEAVVASTPETWIVAADGKRLLAHFPGDPADLSTALIEASVRNRIFAPHRRGLNDIAVRGFVFEHCANQGGFPQRGAVSVRSGQGWLIAGNTIRFAKTSGVDIGSETFHGKDLQETDEDQKVRMDAPGRRPATVEGNLVTDNGLSGIIGWKHNGAIIRNNDVERNNALGFTNNDVKWEEWAGIKLHAGPAVIEGNLVRDNDAYGIWLDNDYNGSRITRNTVLNNRMAGIFLELGDGRAMIDNNVVAFTRPRDAFYAGCGVYAHDSSGITIAHNLIVGNADCGVLLRTISERVFEGTLVHTSHTRVLNNILWNNSRAAISLPYPSARGDDNLSDYNLVYGSRDVWLGFDSNPGLFSVNLYKASATVPIDTLYATLKDLLAKAGVPDEERPPFKAWKRNPTLTLAQWRLLMQQDLHSAEIPDGLTLTIRTAVPMLTIRAKAPVLQMACPPVEGVDRDFLGAPIRPPIHPGPFQGIGEQDLEIPLHPLRAVAPGA